MSSVDCEIGTTESDEVSVLMLGDGDFTYSLDLARYLASNNVKGKIHLIATGIDSRQEVLSKYKDSPYILERISAAQAPSLQVTTLHEVNAIVGSSANGNQDLPRGVEYVVFNHPHLGTEDAVLHAQFLHHFFHSCVSFWMGTNGLLQLTLVEGQYERWRTEDAALRQGLVLIKRQPFVPPPIQPATYSLRRHQTGKSFASRRPKGSEIFFFRRKGDLTDVLEKRNILAFLGVPTEEIRTTNPGTVDNGIQKNDYSCPHCDKTFRERRSLVCHLRDRHPKDSDKRAKTSNIDVKESMLLCTLCTTDEGKPRTFSTEQALLDHQKAKHVALHQSISPDWAHPENADTNGVLETKWGCCNICAVPFRDEEDSSNHLDLFMPTQNSGFDFQCQFCEKTFRENRARRQHENFCPKRAALLSTPET